MFTRLGRSDGKPHERLTEIADAILTASEAVIPDSVRVMVFVTIDTPNGGDGGMALQNYGTSKRELTKAAADAATHSLALSAIASASA